MRNITAHPIRMISRYLALALLATSVGLAQSSPPPPAEAPSQVPNAATGPGWHRFTGPPPVPDPPAAQNNANSPSAKGDLQSQTSGSNQPPDPPSDPQDQAGQAQQNEPTQSQQNQTMPSQLRIKPGTFVTVRINQYLSSNENHAGDAFSATLARPIVADGVVVAQPGETVGGRVAEAQKAGRIKGVSRLALELTDLTLVDGRQVTVATQLSGGQGPTSRGRDAAAIGGTTAAGAAIGAAADGGPGAAIGAGAGAVASTVGVLLTRGKPTVVYPESVLTFRIANPVTISTSQDPQAFRYVQPSDYQQPAPRPSPSLSANGCQGYGCPPPPAYYYGAPYPYYYGYGWPGYYPLYGPGFSFFYAPGFYGRGFYGHGFYGGGGFHGGGHAR